MACCASPGTHAGGVLVGQRGAAAPSLLGLAIARTGRRSRRPRPIRHPLEPDQLEDGLEGGLDQPLSPLAGQQLVEEGAEAAGGARDDGVLRGRGARLVPEPGEGRVAHVDSLLSPARRTAPRGFSPCRTDLSRRRDPLPRGRGLWWTTAGERVAAD